MRVALFFGTFDPLHIGHVAIVGHVLGMGVVNEVWFVLSPHNPKKELAHIRPFNIRAKELQQSLAYYNDERLVFCDVEDRLSRPSYTMVTLEYLVTLYPDNLFYLLIGGDSLLTLPSWYRGEELMSRFPILVYPRGEVREVPVAMRSCGTIQMVNAPLLEISSTYIREGKRVGKNMRFFEAARCEK